MKPATDYRRLAIRVAIGISIAVGMELLARVFIIYTASSGMDEFHRSLVDRTLSLIGALIVLATSFYVVVQIDSAPSTKRIILAAAGLLFLYVGLNFLEAFPSLSGHPVLGGRGKFHRPLEDLLFVSGYGFLVLGFFLFTIGAYKNRELLIQEREALAQQIEQRHRAENDLRKSHDSLERRVEERTAELIDSEKKLHKSEREYRHLVESANDVIYRVNINGKFTYVNPVAVRLLGFEEGELIGKHYLDLVHPNYRDEAMSVAVDQYEGLIPNTYYEFPAIGKDGREVWMGQNSQPVFEGDRVVGFQAVCRDITERKLTEEKLRRTLEQIEKHNDDLLSILDQMRVGIIMTDEKGMVTFLSQTFQKLFETGESEVRGLSWERLLPLPDSELDQLKAMIDRPADQRFKVSASIESPGGRRYWLDIDVRDDPRDPRRKFFFCYDMSEIHYLRSRLTESVRFRDLIGKSRPMKLLYDQIRGLAEVDSTVLIEGETGTGKELVARAIHDLSRRKNGPFVAVNMAGLTDSLITTQLFGHRRGAFTGAIAHQPGLFEAANGGTLFLDEIGDIPMNVQRNLLRVLQEREIVRVGESKPRKIDARILIATNRVLSEEVKKGNFRSDLYYRIQVARVHLPPLRERSEDVPLLVRAFLDTYNVASGKAVAEVSRDAMRALLHNAWPGNVRELQSAIESSVIRCQSSVIQLEDLPPEIASSGGVERPAFTGDAPRADGARILSALQQTNGNRSNAAKLLGISRATLYRRLASLEAGQDGLASAGVSAAPAEPELPPIESSER